MLTEQQLKALNVVCDAALKSGGISVYGSVAVLLTLVNPAAPPPRPHAPEELRAGGNGKEEVPSG